MGVEQGQSSGEGRELIPEGVEVGLVSSLDVGEGSRQRDAAGRGEAQLSGTAVGMTGAALEQSARLELTGHLTGHHRVDPRLLG